MEGNGEVSFAGNWFGKCMIRFDADARERKGLFVYDLRLNK